MLVGFFLLLVLFNDSYALYVVILLVHTIITFL